MPVLSGLRAEAEKRAFASPHGASFLARVRRDIARQKSVRTSRRTATLRSKPRCNLATSSSLSTPAILPSARYTFGFARVSSRVITKDRVSGRVRRKSSRDETEITVHLSYSLTPSRVAFATRRGSAASRTTSTSLVLAARRQVFRYRSPARPSFCRPISL